MDDFYQTHTYLEDFDKEERQIVQALKAAQKKQGDMKELKQVQFDRVTEHITISKSLT